MSQLLVFAVIGIGFLATVVGVVVLIYLLLADLLSRANGSPHSGLIGDRPLPHTHVQAFRPGLPARGERDPFAGGTNIVRDPSSRVGSHDTSAPPPLAPTAPGGAREVGADELPHQLWTGRLR